MRQKVNRRIFRGFTLIELLIVVLIIGILAAIAVPQYQKSVLKSRFSSLVPLGKALNESNEAYYMEHGNYSDSLGSLDVTTNDNNVQVTMGNEDQHQYVLLTRGDIKNNLRIYQKHSPNFAGETHCEALQGNAQANWLCKDGLKGTWVGNKSGYIVYTLNTDKPTGVLGRVYYKQSKLQLTEGDTCIGDGNDSCIQLRVNGGSCTGQRGSNTCSGTYTNYARCEGNSGNSCHNSSYSNYSVCIGNSSNACGLRSSFNNHSVCQANVLGACGGSYSGAYPSTYDETSYCAGNFCPNGAPSNDPTKIWYREDDWGKDRPSELVEK